MSDSVRCWLVERTYDERNLVTLVYATQDGSQKHIKQQSIQLLKQSPPTAAKTISSDQLVPVDDETTRNRYAKEVDRMAANHSPDETI
ncbi:MAG: hypothetical protein ABEI06_04800 [Halobacteriaceae archaeon]